jgi:hypothetical protein
MILKPINECDRDFDFFPMRSWPPLLPPYAWRDHLVSGFDRRTGLALNFDTCELAEILKATYEKFNVFELARWWQILRPRPAHHDSSQMIQLCDMSGLKWCDHLEGTLSAIVQLPLHVQHWCEERKWTAGDVQILRSLPSLDEVTAAFTKMQQTRATRSQGVEILEIYGELQLLQVPPAVRLGASTSADAWLKELRQLRFPLATRTLEQKNSELAKAPWPKSTSARWVREGDKMKLEVTIGAENGTDLSRRLKQLESVSYEI